MAEEAQNGSGTKSASSGEDAPNMGPKQKRSGALKMPDDVVEAVIEEEEAEADQSRIAGKIGASHEGGMGAQGGQTDFGNPGKF